MSTILPGNTAFVLLSAALVMIMTPGLGLFYGGLVGKKNVLTILMESFFSLGWVTILWIIAGFSLAFGPSVGYGFIGSLRYAFFMHIHEATSLTAYKIPLLSFAMFQLMFAVITPALITGAFANKMKFKAYIVFLTLWSFIVYFPVAHWLWGGGFLQKWGAEDFAGGIVVHTTAGFSALATALYLGVKKEKDNPHNVVLVALGTALLWFGWFGFNAGSALRAGGDAAVAFSNTQVAASFAAITWVLLDIARGKKLSTTGFCTGAIAGLATITPAAGYVNPQASIVIGIVASLATYGAVQLKNRKGWDDVLDVWGVHGIGGFTGIILLGIFGSAAILGSNGLIYGNAVFFGKEVASAVLGAGYSFALTYGILWLIDKTMKLRVTDEELKEGLDLAELGETAYQ
ncbi:MAG: ammonium transporter [Caldisphaeraceae archaeon]|nr:ammonium transporter [Caldisphaeraceae archaeon]MEB3797384.1 ammonium transporter [Caldisphaeraceae archaeon]